MNTKRKPKTTDRIIDTALQLFNNNGSHKITTNHIAREMGISPGNLYYHYNNKEHIIRELLSRLIAGFDSLVRMEQGGSSNLDLVAETIHAVGDLVYTYRFIYVELAALLARDDAFKTLYNDIKARRAGEFVLLFDVVALSGVFRQKITPDERDALIFIIWTYTEGIITALHTSDIPVTPETVRAHFKKVVYILKAYLQPDVWDQLARKLDLP